MNIIEGKTYRIEFYYGQPGAIETFKILKIEDGVATVIGYGKNHQNNNDTINLREIVSRGLKVTEVDPIEKVLPDYMTFVYGNNTN
jgi:hypothetical protein